MIRCLLTAVGIAAIAATSATAASFEDELANAQRLVNQKLIELNEELAKEWGVESPVASAEIAITFPSNDSLPNPFPVTWESERNTAFAPLTTAAGGSGQIQTIVLPQRSQRCATRTPPSSFAQWALGYLWRCDKGPFLLWDFYGFTGYSHSMMFFK